MQREQTVLLVLEDNTQSQVRRIEELETQVENMKKLLNKASHLPFQNSRISLYSD